MASWQARLVPDGPAQPSDRVPSTGGSKERCDVVPHRGDGHLLFGVVGNRVTSIRQSFKVSVEVSPGDMRPAPSPQLGGARVPVMGVIASKVHTGVS